MKCTKHNVEMDMETNCHVCHGDGIIEAGEPWNDDLHTETCWNCKGSGHGLDDCWLCYEEEIDA